MTTPAPGLVTGSFAGTLTPAQVWALLNALVEGSPFAASLTRANTSTGKLAFPTVGPTGFAWLEELQEVPSLLLNDKALIVSVAKVAGLLPVSSEMQSDAAVNITTWVQRCPGRQPEPRPGPRAAAGDRQPPARRDHRPGRRGIRPDADRRGRCRHRGHRRGRRHHQHDRACRPTTYAAELTATDADGRLVHPDGPGRPDRAGHRAGSGPGPAAGLRRGAVLPGAGPGQQRHDPR